MIKVYYGSKLDNINWKIEAENVGKSLSYFSSSSTPNDVASKLCQFSLFDTGEKVDLYVVDINDWKLTDKSTQQIIRDLHSLDVLVCFVIETSSLKNKLFSELKLETIKCNAVTHKAKEQAVHYYLNQAGISLNIDTEQLLVDLLPEKIDFIKNEINKLRLLDQDKFSKDEIKKIVFNTGDATIFNVIESWLNNDLNQTIERINDLLASNYTVNDIIPIFAYTLMQLKFYLLAKLAKWSSGDITTKQGLAFWQQNKYANLKPYDKTLLKVNEMLSKLYNFDINTKKQKNIPYSQLIKILFE